MLTVTSFLNVLEVTYDKMEATLTSHWLAGNLGDPHLETWAQPLQEGGGRTADNQLGGE